MPVKAAVATVTRSEAAARGIATKATMNVKVMARATVRAAPECSTSPMSRSVREARLEGLSRVVSLGSAKRPQISPKPP